MEDLPKRLPTLEVYTEKPAETIATNENAQVDGDAKHVVDSMLPHLAKVPQSDRKKVEGYLELAETSSSVEESTLVDIFWDAGIPDKGDNHYDSVQEKVDEILLDNNILGDEAIPTISPKMSIK